MVTATNWTIYIRCMKVPEDDRIQAPYLPNHRRHQHATTIVHDETKEATAPQKYQWYALNSFGSRVKYMYTQVNF